MKMRCEKISGSLRVQVSDPPKVESDAAVRCAHAVPSADTCVLLGEKMRALTWDAEVYFIQSTKMTASLKLAGTRAGA